MHTYFAPPHKVEDQILRGQIETVCNSPVMDALLQTSCGMMLIVNEARQIVAINYSFLSMLGIDDVEQVLGLRLGETLHCKYAFNEPAGCGTTRYCSSCGAIIALMAAIDDDRECERICALTISQNGQQRDICLLVRAMPMQLEGKRLIIVYAQDVSQQQFWASLERIFFHDINNMVCAMRNYSKYFHDKMPVNPLSARQKMLAERMFQEVKMQSKLASVRDSEEIVSVIATDLSTIRNQVFNIVLVSNAMDNKRIIEEGTTGKLLLKTDPMLVSKVLTNMLLNALEATDAGGSVVFRALTDDGRVEWQVWNSAVMAENIQLRIFQRYFSTKGAFGHGLGTYSMKFFGETCLGGKVSFTSSAETGTTFRFSLPLGVSEMIL